MKTMFNKKSIKIISKDSGGIAEYDYDYFAEGFEEWAENLDIDLPDVEDLKQYLDEEGYNTEIEELD